MSNLDQIWEVIMHLDIWHLVEVGMFICTEMRERGIIWEGKFNEELYQVSKLVHG